MVKATNIEVGLTLNDQATKGLQKFEDALDSAGAEGKQAFDKVSKEAKEAGAAIDKATGRTRDARERVVKLGTDGEKAFTKVGKEAKETGAAVKGTGNKARDAGDKFTKLGGKGKKGLGQIDKAAKKSSVSLGKMALAIGAAFAAFKAFQVAGRTGLGFIRDAAKFEEDVAKFGVVFGEEALRVAEQLDVLSGAVKRSKGELVGFTSGFQDILVPLGFARDEAADLSVGMTKLAIDIGSFNNALDADVIRDLTSAMVGNHETVRKFGILIDEGRIKSFAYANGIAKVGEEITAQQKVVARMNIIMADTSDAFGDAERTAGSFANTMKGVQAVASDLGIVFGQELQKTVLDNIKAMGGLDGVTDIIKVSFAAVTTATEAMIDAVGTAGVAFKGLIDGLGGADKVVALIRGEFELTEEAGKDLALAIGQLDRLFVAAFDVMISSAAVAGDAVATGFFTALGLNFDREARKFLVVYGDFARDWAQGNPLAIPEFVIDVAAAGGLEAFAENQIQGAAEAAEAGGGVTAEAFVASLNRELTGAELNLERLLFATKQGGDSFKPGSVENLVRREFKLDPAAVEEMESTARATLKGMLDSVAEVGPSSPAGDKLREVIQQSLHMEGLEPSFKDGEARLQELYTQLAAAGSGEVFREELAKGSEGLYQPLIANLRSDDAERVAAQSKAKLEAILTDLRNVGADVELITIGRGRGQQQVIKFSDAFRADPNANKDAIAVLTKYLDPGAIQQAVADKLKPLDMGVGAIEPFVLKLEDIVDETGLEREAREKRERFQVIFGDFTESFNDFTAQAITDLETRELSIAEAFSLEDADIAVGVFEKLGGKIKDVALVFAGLKVPAAEAGADAGEALGDSVVVSAKDALKALSAQLRVVTEEVKAGIVSDFAAFELGIQIKIAKVEGDEALSDDERARGVAALNAQLGMEIQLRTAAEATAIRQRQSENGRLSIATSMVALIQAQLVPMAEAAMAQERIEESEQRILELRASLGDDGARWQLEVNAINQAADASIAFATARADQSATEQELLRQEIALINAKRDATLGTVKATGDVTKATSFWTKALGEQTAGQKLQTDLAASFDTAISGIARSMVDSEASWADFRDSFLQGIGQMIVEALILAAIKAAVGFASGGVANGDAEVVTNAKGGVTTGVGSMATGPAPPNSFAMGGVQGGTMKAHSDDLGFERGAKIMKAFADGGIMEGVDSHIPIRAFANGGVMGGLPIHQYAEGGIARTPQLAVFGEGRGAEAFVPLPDGKSIPVKMDGVAQTVNVSLTVSSLDPSTAADVVLAQMPKIRKELASSLREGTDRSLVEGVRGAARR